MNGHQWRLVALALLLGAVGAAAYGVSAGLLQFAFVLVFPVLFGSSAFVIVPALLLFGAFFAWGAAAYADARASAGAHPRHVPVEDRPAWAPHPDEEWHERSWRSGARDEMEAPAKRKAKWGGVVLLGPIPIAFGNDRRLLVVLMALAVVLVALVLGAMLVGRAA